MRKFLQILLAIIIAGSCTSGPPSAAVATSNCSDVEFIFARGSGESLGGPSATAWEEALRRQLSGSSLKYDFYELGSTSYYGAQYPAVAVSGSVSGIGNLLGAFVSSGESFNFARSVAIGRSELKSHIKSVAKVCSQTKFVLGGYSQGAMLISGILDELPAEKIIYVATFGDPKLYLPEGKGNRPLACRGQNLSNYRAYVTDCHAYEGVLGSYRPYQPADYYDKIGTWCNDEDIMCSSGFNIDDHTKYTKLGLYANAAGIISDKLNQAYPEKFTYNTEVVIKTSSQDLVIFWHAGIGGNLSSSVASYKLVAQRLINQTYSLGGRVALYVYSESMHGQSIKLCDFSCTADEVNQKLASITSLLATGTHYNCPFYLMRTAFNELDWQVGATKSAVVLTDDPLDYTDHISVTLDEIAKLSLEIDPVNIYPIMNANALETGQRLAEATNGKAYALTDANLAVQEITQRPEAGLALTQYVGNVGDEFTFDATKTNNGQLLPSAKSYAWDLDADGIFELQSPTGVVQHTYTAPIDGYIQVRVTDDFGRSSTMSARLIVSDTVADPPIITNLRAEKNGDVYNINFQTDATQVLVILNGAPMGVMTISGDARLFIKDVNYRTSLQLIPYRKTGGRGETAEISFGPNIEYQLELPGNDEVTEMPTEDGNETNESPDITSSTNPEENATSNPAANLAQTVLAYPMTAGTITIPKAPNTGVHLSPAS